MTDKPALPFEQIEQDIVAAVQDAIQEADAQKILRKKLNKKNHNIFHGRHKFNKQKGQSHAFLHKTHIIVEQLTASLKEILEKIEVERIGGEYENEDIFIPELTKGILKLYLKKAEFNLTGMEGLHNMMLEGQSTLKVGGYKDEDKNWCLGIWNVPFEDYYQDPYSDLYKINKKLIDKHELVRRAKIKSYGYNLDIIKELGTGTDKDESDKTKKAGNDSKQVSNRRKQIILHEFWGTLLDADGDVMRYKDENGKEIELENVTLTIANESRVIRKPIKNPKWHGRPPYVTGKALLTPGAIHPKAPMDPTSDLAIIQSELFNLMVDGGLASVFGVRQVRPSMLKDRRQLEKGISSQTTLVLRDDAPAGEKAVEQVTTGQAPNELLPFYRILENMIAEMGLLGSSTGAGALAGGQKLATELVQVGEAVQKVLEKVAQTIAQTWIEPLAHMAFCDIIENVDAFPEDDLIRIVALDIKDLERATQLVQKLNQLPKEERKKRVAGKFKFQGITKLDAIKKAQDLQKFQAIMGTFLANPVLIQEYNKEWSVPRLIQQTVEAMGIDPYLIKKTQEEIKFEQELAKIRENAMIQNELAGNQNAQAGNSGSARGAQPTAPQAPVQPAGQ